MDSETVVLCYPATAKDIALIESAFPDSRVLCSDQENIGSDIAKATIFCGHAKRKQIDWQTVVDEGRLKWIQSSAAGLDHCLVPAVVESKIVVSGCSGLFADQVSEQTLAILMGLIRRLPEFHNAQAQRKFERLPTDTLHGKSVGIIGFGGNGRRIAGVLRTIAGQILATDWFPNYSPPPYVDLLPADRSDKLFCECDIVIVTLPLTPTTKGGIGAREFGQMKKGSYFVNVARGAVVDQPALLQALAEGNIAFAGLDVVDPEPPAFEDPIWQSQQVLITPHVGAQSELRVPMTTELFCRNAERFRNGTSLLNQVDKQLQFPRPEHRISVDENGRLLW